MRRILIIAFAFLAVVAGFFAWFIQDANRLKPALVTQLERLTGVPIEIRGDLAWQFMPRLWLGAEDLYATHVGRAWSAGRLAVRPDIVSLVRNPGNPDRWRIEEAVVRDLAVDDAGGGLVRAPRLSMRRIGLGNPAPVEGLIVYVTEGGEPVEAALAGTLILEPDRFSARDFSFRMRGAAGTCDLQAMPNGKLWPPLAPVENEILPLGILRTYDWDGRCDIERIERRGEAIENVAVVLDNKEGGSIVSVDAPEFLGGRAQLEVIVQAGALPVTWNLRPAFAGVDSRRLAAWLGGGSLVAGPVDYGGDIRLEGNTSTALAASINARTRFSAGPGEIDVGAMAEPLAEVSALLNSDGSVTGVPATVDYENLDGVWVVDGERHRLDFSLDSLRLEAGGDYLVEADNLDLRGVIDPGGSIEQWGLGLAPALAGAHFHFRCRGTAAEPGCRLDVERTFLDAGAAKGSAVARELIDAHVPAEYRAAARSFLDSLEAEVDAALRKDPEALIGEHVPERYRGMARSLLEKLGEALEEEH
ncbi:MAG: hypothetical protein OXP09_10595 [Gammaproteobacteria bacterium]|nr:hypothetical protein [Gammaproteobacteria bacterium]MDE0366006.1 hypothetical protein [Gammaproteobacteria bacterium]